MSDMRQRRTFEDEDDVTAGSLLDKLKTFDVYQRVDERAKEKGTTTGATSLFVQVSFFVFLILLQSLLLVTQS